jgi:hypothetical protein
MNNDEFWQIIDSVNAKSGGDMGRKCELLKDRLKGLTEPDLKDFINHFETADAGPYTWSLWGAAYVMHGGCSDDSFSDFRATLISLGSKTYKAALSNPETLADIDFQDEDDICYEGFQYVKNDVAEDMLGEIPKIGTPFPDEPAGEEWVEDTVYSLYPRLSAKYSFIDETSDGIKHKKPWWKFW